MSGDDANGVRRRTVEQWADYYDERDEGQRLHRARQRAEQGISGPSWGVVDMEAALNELPLTADIGHREDGVALLYRGKSHVLYGDSFSGKTWLALLMIKQVLVAGGRVLFLDFEDDAKGVGFRLMRMGVERWKIAGPGKLFDYRRPEGSFDADENRADFAAILKSRYDLAVLDGVTESMSFEGLSHLDGGDVATWQAMLLRKLATKTGAAVLCIDHVTKDPDKAGRPIGSERKVSGVDGCAYLLQSVNPMMDGKIGVAALRIAKDRHGQVNRYGVDYDAKSRTHLLAHFELDSTEAGASDARLCVPSAKPTADETENEKAERQRRHCCWFMERVSQYFEDVVPDGETYSKETVIKAMCEERKEAGMKQQRDYWRDAIGFLIAEGYLSGPTEVSKGKACPLEFVKPYRQENDPKSDRYRDPEASRRRVIQMPQRGEGA